MRKQAHLTPTALPVELTERIQWIVWKFEEREGKTTKVPYIPGTYAKRMAATDKSATWRTFEEAVSDYHIGCCDGIGYVFSGSDPYFGVDIDQAFDDTDALTQDAHAIVMMLDTYTEISPSGRGLHLIGKGVLPPGARRRGKFEMYDRGRYFTMSGNIFDSQAVIHECKSQIEQVHAKFFAATGEKQPAQQPAPQTEQPSLDLDDDSALLERMFAASNGYAIRTLWAGDTTGYPSHSEADSALCAHLAFWTGRDAARMDRLFRQSKLMREKWDRRHYSDGRTYGQGAIDFAIQNTGEVYTPSLPGTIKDTLESIYADMLQKQPELVSYHSNGTHAPPAVDEQPHADQQHGVPVSDAWEPPTSLFDVERQAFPTHVLPEWLREYVEAVSEEIQVPIDMTAMLALALCAVTVQRKMEVAIRSGWRETLSLYVMITAESGERKSAAMRAIVDPALAYELTEVERLRPEIAREASDRRIDDNRLRDAESTASKTDNVDKRNEALATIDELTPKLNKPLRSLPQLFADDITPEKLCDLLNEQDERIAIFVPEGGDFLALLAGRYSDKPNFGIYLRGYTGEQYRYDRKGNTKQGIIIEKPAITLALTVQPSVFTEAAETPSFRGRGLFARFLFAMPKPMLGYRKRSSDVIPMPAYVKTRYDYCIMKMLSLPISKDERGKPVAYALQLDEGAQNRLYDFQDWIEPQLRDFAELEDTRDWAAKLTGQVARLAAILHIADNIDQAMPWTLSIDAETMRRAILIGHYAIAHARVSFRLLKANQDVANAHYILRYLKERSITEITRRDLWSNLKKNTRFDEDGTFDKALKKLVQHDYLREVVQDQRKQGRPSTKYQVNPYLMGF